MLIHGIVQGRTSANENHASAVQPTASFPD